MQKNYPIKTTYHTQDIFDKTSDLIREFTK